MWSRLEDNFYDHPKVLAVGNAAVGAFVRMITYSTRYLTDGFVAERKVLDMAEDDQGVVARLVEHNLLHKEHGGYRIHDYSHYHPDTKEKREARHVAAVAAGKASAAARRK